MINYRPFWETLRLSRESTYTLIKNHHIPSSTIDKLRKNKPLNTTTINDLCSPYKLGQFSSRGITA